MMKWVSALLLCAVVSAWAAEGTLRGRYYFGHEVESFQPCGSKKSYWVRADDSLLRPLRERAERLRVQRGKPYQPVYVEAVGTLDTKSEREGFARDYDGLLQLRKVSRASDVVPKACRK